jgi:hypothetical protein
MPRIQYTVLDAIRKAEEIASSPEVLLSHDQTHGLIAALLAGIKTSQCFYKGLVNGRRTFVLLEGDPAAAFAIMAWAGAAERAGHREEKIQDAVAIADAFEHSPLLKKSGGAALNPAAAWPFPKK